MAPVSSALPRTKPLGTLKILTSLACSALLGSSLSACSTHHWAEVASSRLPPPPGPRELHTSRLVVDVTELTEETQCVVYEKYSPVCFYNVRKALEEGLARGLWPSFPEVTFGPAEDARPGDYVLQVEVILDALPPDEAGPGWSAGVRGRYRLMQDGQVRKEETLSSRSRADLPYGAPLGTGATDVVDAAIVHIVSATSAAEERNPYRPTPLPAVAARDMTAPAKSAREVKRQEAVPAPKTATAAKSLPDAAPSDAATDPGDSTKPRDPGEVGPPAALESTPE